MSGNDCWNENVFSHWQKVAIDRDDWTWTSKVFQTIAAATGNVRRPMVVRRDDGTNSSSVDDDRRRRRPGRSDTGTSWFKYASAHDNLKATFITWTVGALVIGFLCYGALEIFGVIIIIIIKGPGVYILPLSGKPEQQRFTIEVACWPALAVGSAVLKWMDFEPARKRDTIYIANTASFP